MDEGSILSVLIIVVLLFFAAYFAMTEIAFASASRIRIKTAAERGDARAKKALYIIDHFDKAITALLIGNNIVHLATASYVTVLVTRRWGITAVSISTIVTTIVVFLLGEMLPKSLGKRYSNYLALATASSLRFFMRIFAPISVVLTFIGNAAARITKGDSTVTVTEDELYDIIENMTDEGELDEERGELVNNALSFSEVTVESILTSRVDLAALDVDSTSAEVITYIKSQRHSRIPVYEGSIDNIIGILQIRKYIRSYIENNDVDIRSLLDEPLFIHQSTNIDELLPALSRRKANMAVVTDNYGGTLGIVTVEDILEELVGEIWDEDDVVAEPYRQNADGSYSFDATVDIEDAFEFMDYEDPDEFDFEHKLLGEWAYEQFDFIPSEGESFVYGTLRIIIEETANHRIMKLRIETIEETEEGGDAQ